MASAQAWWRARCVGVLACWRVGVLAGVLRARVALAWRARVMHVAFSQPACRWRGVPVPFSRAVPVVAVETKTTETGDHRNHVSASLIFRGFIDNPRFPGDSRIIAPTLATPHFPRTVRGAHPLTSGRWRDMDQSGPPAISLFRLSGAKPWTLTPKPFISLQIQRRNLTHLSSCAFLRFRPLCIPLCFPSCRCPTCCCPPCRSPTCPALAALAFPSPRHAPTYFVSCTHTHTRTHTHTLSLSVSLSLSLSLSLSPQTPQTPNTHTHTHTHTHSMLLPLHMCNVEYMLLCMYVAHAHVARMIERAIQIDTT